MGKVIVSFTMSLDGFVAGTNVDREHPMGEGGDRLHRWLFDTASDLDKEMATDMSARVGAVVLGRRTFDVGLQHWEDTPYPAPSFVLTHEKRSQLKMKSAAFTFVNDGVRSALRQARQAAGSKDIVIMGASTAQQVLTAGLVEEVTLQLAPILLGKGCRLFDKIGSAIELKSTQVAASPLVTHLRFDVL